MSPLAKSLQTQFLRYSALVKKLHRGAHGKDVHELRTLSRQLRADLWVLETSTDTKVPAQLKSHLKKLTRTLSEARQLHVLYKDALRYKLPVKRIDQKRQAARKKIEGLLKLKWQLRLFEDLQDFEKRLSKKKVLVKRPQAQKLLKESAQHLKEAKPPKTEKKWHERRVEMRKLQHRMEVLGLPTPALKNLQSSLGKAHDLHILKEMFPENPILARDEKKALATAQRFYKARMQKTLATLEK